MSKSRAPRLSVEGLKERKAEFTELMAVSSRLAQMEALRKEKVVNTPFIALEALSAIVGAKIAGHDDQDVRRTWPEDWGANSVEVPLALLQVLGQVWRKYRNPENDKMLISTQN